ncbi:uncharacterized protein LOC112893261 isoform X8 [Panicum hallii]|uniref:uncharacterized protein LOC112893261 isoform X8 n=1 Tax=Panicum hallii TaxID=206008 RepID=UPI000DF4D6DF|nr:uncharacterized protein LOC112893261 isoform X8 [Panicum hallii]
MDRPISPLVQASNASRWLLRQPDVADIGLGRGHGPSLPQPHRRRLHQDRHRWCLQGRRRGDLRVSPQRGRLQAQSRACTEENVQGRRVLGYCTIAGVYVGVEYGIDKIRGHRDWKNAMLGGAVTGALISAVNNHQRHKVVKNAITGGAIATAAELLTHLSS